MAFCCFPYGACILTAFYGVFCYLILDFGQQCSDEKCRSEGVDNAPVAWASNFFIAGFFPLLGAHIFFKQRESGKAFVAFLSWSISHAIWGVVALRFGNDGTSDGKGVRGYYILNMLGYVFATESLIEFAGLAARLWVTIQPEYRPRCCGRSPLRFYELLVTLTILVIASGSLWCSALPEVWGKETLDEYSNDVEDSDIHTCIHMIDIGQVVFTAVTSLFWVAVASIYASFAKEHLEELNQWYYVWGFPSSLAAAAVICFQTMIFIFHLLAFTLQRRARAEPDHVIATTASIAYHYSILMTGFFAHNFIESMSLSKNSPHETIHQCSLSDDTPPELLESDDSSADTRFFESVKIIPSSSAGLQYYPYDEEASTSFSSRTERTIDSLEYVRNNNDNRSLLDDAAMAIETVYSNSQHGDRKRIPLSNVEEIAQSTEDPSVGTLEDVDPVSCMGNTALCMESTKSPSNEVPSMAMNHRPVVRSNTNDFGTPCTAGMLSFVSGMLFPDSSWIKEEKECNPREPEPESEESSKGWSSGSSSSQGTSELRSHQTRRNSVTKYSLTQEQPAPKMDREVSCSHRSDKANLRFSSALSLAAIGSMGSELDIYPIPEEDSDMQGSDEQESALVLQESKETNSRTALTRRCRRGRSRQMTASGPFLFVDNSYGPEVESAGEKLHFSPTAGSEDEQSSVGEESRDDLLGGIQIVWTGDV